MLSLVFFGKKYGMPRQEEKIDTHKVQKNERIYAGITQEIQKDVFDAGIIGIPLGHLAADTAAWPIYTAA